MAVSKDRTYEVAQVGVGNAFGWVAADVAFPGVPIPVDAGDSVTLEYRLRQPDSSLDQVLEPPILGSVLSGALITGAPSGGSMTVRMLADPAATQYSAVEGERPGQRETYLVEDVLVPAGSRIYLTDTAAGALQTSFGSERPDDRVVRSPQWSGRLLFEYLFTHPPSENVEFWWLPPPPPYEDLSPAMLTSEARFVTGIPELGHDKSSVLRFCVSSGRRMYEEDMVEDGYRVGVLVDPEQWDEPDRGHRPMVGTPVRRYV